MLLRYNELLETTRRILPTVLEFVAQEVEKILADKPMIQKAVDDMITELIPASLTASVDQ